MGLMARIINWASMISKFFKPIGIAGSILGVLELTVIGVTLPEIAATISLILLVPVACKFIGYAGKKLIVAITRVEEKACD